MYKKKEHCAQSKNSSPSSMGSHTTLAARIDEHWADKLIHPIPESSAKRCFPTPLQVTQVPEKSD